MIDIILMNILSITQLPTDAKQNNMFHCGGTCVWLFLGFFLQEKKRNESAIVTTLLPTVKKKSLVLMSSKKRRRRKGRKKKNTLAEKNLFMK